MRMSKLFGRTLRDVPADSDGKSYELLIRAGLARKLVSGSYSLLPLLQRSLQKLQRILREELDAIGGQEISLPLVQPADLWPESRRWPAAGPELAHFLDRNGRELLLAVSEIEAVTDLARKEISSYRQLPCLLYQLQAKFSDEARPRAGLIYAKESVRQEAFSFHADSDDLDRFYQQVVAAYQRIWQRLGLPDALLVLAEQVGPGGKAHEFMLPTPSGEDKLLYCPSCGYAAKQAVAEIGRPESVRAEGGEQPTLVHTPGQKDIGQVAAYLGLQPPEVLKTLVYQTTAGLALVVISGDLQVNERKLAMALGDRTVALAAEEAVQAAALPAGFISPVGLPGLPVYADLSVQSTASYVAGANRVDYHLQGVVPGRDFAITGRFDLALAAAGHPCPLCAGELLARQGIKLGHTRQLGTIYSGPMRADYYDAGGANHPLVMGSYGSDLWRLLACVLETHHDDFGIIWPRALAPYHVQLLTAGKDDQTLQCSQEIYQQLWQAGVETLWDEREATAGVKFNDADLIGLPYRLVIGRKQLAQGLVEVKRRDQTEKLLLPLDQVVDYLSAQSAR